MTHREELMVKVLIESASAQVGILIIGQFNAQRAYLVHIA